MHTSKRKKVYDFGYGLILYKEESRYYLSQEQNGGKSDLEFFLNDDPVWKKWAESWDKDVCGRMKGKEA